MLTVSSCRLLAHALRRGRVIGRRTDFKPVSRTQPLAALDNLIIADTEHDQQLQRVDF